MKRRVLNFINYFRLVKLLNNSTTHKAWYEIVQKVAEFATEVQQNGKPMLTRISVIDMSDEKIIGDFDMVSLWAGVGDANPIERGRQLKAQNVELKRLLKLCVDNMEPNDNLSVNIRLVLDTFE